MILVLSIAERYLIKCPLFGVSVKRDSTVPQVTNFPGNCAFIIGFSFTVWTKKSAKTFRKQVRGCLQNLYQSVAIHLKYVLLVLL